LETAEAGIARKTLLVFTSLPTPQALKSLRCFSYPGAGISATPKNTCWRCYPKSPASWELSILPSPPTI